MTVLLVSWVLALLSVFSLTFHQESRADLRRTNWRAEEVRAGALARSGVALARRAIEASGGNEWDSPAEGWDGNPAAFQRVSLGEGFVSVGRVEGTAPNDRVVYGVEDENRRIPLRIVDRDLLARIPELSADEVDAVLAAVEDGEAAPWELAQLDSGARNALRGSFTRSSDGGVNINTASPAVLLALGLSADVTRAIVRRRDGPDGVAGTADDDPFTNLLVPQGGGLEDLDLSSDEAATLSILAREELLGVASDTWRVRSRGWVRDSRSFCEIEAVLRRNAEGTIDVVDWRESWRS